MIVRYNLKQKQSLNVYIVMCVIFKLFTLEFMDFTSILSYLAVIYFSKCEIFGNISIFYFLKNNKNSNALK